MKYKIHLIILALAVLAVAALLVSRQGSDATPYESFSLVMDRLSGPGQWSAQGHEESDNGLTVKGLTFSASSSLIDRTFPASSSLISRVDGEGLDGQVTLDSVLVKKLPPRDRLEKLLGLTDWQGQPETELARGLRLQGFHWREARAEGAEIKIEELNLGGLKLAKAAPDAPAGEAGFWQALRLASLDHKNFRLTVAEKEPEVETVFAVGFAACEGLSFDGDIPPAPARPGSGLLFSPWAAFSAKSLKAEGLELDFTGQAPEAPVKISLSLAAFEETDLKAFKSVGALKLSDFQGRLTTGQEQEFSLGLAGLSLSGLDMADYMGQLMAGLAAARDSQEAAEALITGQYTLANFFVSPISLGEAALTGLTVDLAGLASLKADEIKTVGPYRAGEIPASAKSWTKGLEISLPGDPQAEPGSPGRDIYEFSRMLGRTAFAVEAETDSSYEPATGRLTARLGRLSVSELFDLTGSQTWNGLTPDRLEKFKKIPLAALYLAAVNPDDLWGETSINALNLKYTDQGLVDAVFNFQAQAEGAASGAEMKERSIAETGLMLAILGARYIKNTEDLSRPILDFLKTPRSLEIDLKAEPPLTFAGLKALSSEPSVILDSLNITFSANGQAGSPLRFVPSLGDPEPGPGDPAQEDPALEDTVQEDPAQEDPAQGDPGSGQENPGPEME